MLTGVITSYEKSQTTRERTMSDEGKGGGVVAAAGTALAAGSAIVGSIGHAPPPLAGGAVAVTRIESRIASSNGSLLDDVVIRSSDDVTAGVSRQPANYKGATTISAVGRSTSSASTLLTTYKGLADQKLTREYTGIVSLAQPRVAADLIHAPTGVTRAQVTDFIKSDLAQEAAKQAAARPGEITFEVFSGKFAISKTYQFRSARIKFGEVNLYKVATASAIGVMSCRALAKDQLNACVTKALDKAGGLTKDAINAEDLSKITERQVKKVISEVDQRGAGK